MELPALIYFATVVNQGTTSAAAAKLDVSTSTINHCVSTLERAMATPLLSRAPGRQSLEARTTAHGENLYRSALQLLGWSLSLITPDGPAMRAGTPDEEARLFQTDRLRVLLNSGLTLRMIGYFLSVCETGRIAAAARQLSITQPTLSRQIARLETIVGRTLFVRHAHGVRLTADAEILREGCSEADRTYRQIMRDENFSYFLEFRTFKLASMMPSSSDSSLTITLANLVRLWRHHRYQPPLTITTVAAPQMVDGLLDGRFDAGLSDLTDVPSGLGRAVIETSRLHLVTCRTQGARNNQTAQAILASELLAVPALGTGLRRVIDQYLDRETIIPAAIFETQSLSLILRLVADGTCCAILPSGAFRSHALDATPLPEHYRMTTQLLWRKEHANPAMIERLRSCLDEIVARTPSPVGKRAVA